MKTEDFLSLIQDAFDSYEAGHTSKDAAITELVKAFIQVHDPCIKSKEHLQLFIYRVKTMREEQVKYFNGEYKALIVAKRLEVQVDNAINKLVNELGYNLGEITKKYEQQKLL